MIFCAVFSSAHIDRMPGEQQYSNHFNLFVIGSIAIHRCRAIAGRYRFVRNVLSAECHALFDWSFDSTVVIFKVQSDTFFVFPVSVRQGCDTYSWRAYFGRVYYSTYARSLALACYDVFVDNCQRYMRHGIFLSNDYVRDHYLPF